MIFFSISDDTKLKLKHWQENEAKMNLILKKNFFALLCLWSSRTRAPENYAIIPSRETKTLRLVFPLDMGTTSPVRA